MAPYPGGLDGQSEATLLTRSAQPDGEQVRIACCSPGPAADTPQLAAASSWARSRGLRPRVREKGPKASTAGRTTAGGLGCPDQGCSGASD